jgi:hypothetical protein
MEVYNNYIIVVVRLIIHIEYQDTAAVAAL